MATNWKEVKKKRQAQEEIVSIDNAWDRFGNRAWMRDKSGNVYFKEALLLAMLLHTKGKTERGAKELEQIGKIMKDPNLSRTA